MRYLLELSYDGTNYCGWQKQDNAITIQRYVDESLSVLLKEKIKTTGSSRTDAGVHAKIQYAHFDVVNEINSRGKFIYSLNALLPSDIAVNDIFIVDNDFHARFSAIKRVYRYKFIYNKDPFIYKNSTCIYKKLQINFLNKIAAMFERNNLNCIYISKKSDNKESFLCSIYEAYWTSIDNEAIFTISANRFLRGMVRIIISLSIEVMNGIYSLECLDRLLTDTVQIKLPKLVPAKGLTLEKIEYENLGDSLINSLQNAKN